jgi:Rrf2 family transcriptional repressor of oqxAB
VVDLRFASTLQVMLSLALAAREDVAVVSSFTLAEGLGTNPSLVRKLLVPLVQAGLITSTKGKHGGVALARPADQITLADIYRASVPDKRMVAGRSELPHRCVVSSNFEPFLDRLSTRVETAVLSDLARRTLADSLAELAMADRVRISAARRRR